MTIFLLPSISAQKSDACGCFTGSRLKVKSTPVLVRYACPDPFVIQNSSIAEFAAMSLSTALIWSAVIPPFSAEATNWAASIACPAMCRPITSSHSEAWADFARPYASKNAVRTASSRDVIGFAVPINMARRVMQQIVQHGSVRRGHIGVSIKDSTLPVGAPPPGEGALIAGVSGGSPAER